MNNLLKIICKENRNRNQEGHIRHHTNSPDHSKMRADKERRRDCEKVRVQTWMPEV